MAMRTLKVAAVALAAMAVLTACGGGDDSSSKLDLGQVGSIDKTIPDSDYDF